MKRVAACLAAGALAVAGTLAGVQWATSGPAHADEYTISQNLSRDGWDNAESALSPAAVSGKTFGQILDVPVNGQVYAQPLNVGADVLVATENDYVYSINRDTGAVNWSRQVGSPYAASAEGCGTGTTLKPHVGITSAPVYDPSTGTLYVVGMVTGAPGDDTHLTTTTPQWDLFALSESTGAVEWSKQIGGQPDNTTTTRFAFNAAEELERPGLLLLNGSVYMGFGSLCEDANHTYFGYVAGVNTQTQAQSLWVDQTGSLGTAGGVWLGGGGLMSDGTSIYISTGNGGYPKAGSTSAASVDNFAQSVVKLTPQANGTLQPTDFFSPGNADKLNLTDYDFGSGGPITLPFTTSAYSSGLVAMAGKDARLFLLNAASLGGRSATETGSTAVFTGSPALVKDPTDSSGNYTVAHGQWGHPAAIAGTDPKGGTDDYLYYEGTGWGSYDQMYVLKLDATSPSAPVLENIGQTNVTAPAGVPSAGFGFSSGSPVITSSGNAMSSALVWEVYAANYTGAHGSLKAFLALPDSSGTLKQVFSAPIGKASEFSTPATSNGRVYVGARNDGSTATCPTDFESATYTSTDSMCVGHLHVFGDLLAASATSVNLGHVALGQSATKTVTLTNTADVPVTVTKFTAPTVPFGTVAPLAVGQQIPAGATVSLPITFSPQAKGTITGTYQIGVSDGTTQRSYTISVSGVGTAAASGTTAVPSPGGGWTLNGNALMTGATLRLNSAAANQAGSAVFYQPVPSNGLHAKFTVRMNGGSGGDGLTFSLLNAASATTSRGYGASQLGFGGLNGVAVVLGTRKDTGFPSANFIGIATSTAGGHLVLRASTTKVPSLRRGLPVLTVAVAGSRVSVGVNGKTYLTASVRVPSTVLPAFTAANGAHGDVHDVGHATITTTAGTLPQPGGGWSYNGTAGMSGSDSLLTTPAANQRGSVVYTRPVATATFSATFDVQLGGGTGGDGETLALLQPGTATSLGANGTGLGFAGLSGLAVVLGTQQLAGAPSADFAGIETATSGSTPTLVATADLSSLASPISLRTGTHLVSVTVASGTVTVTIDGTVVLTQAMAVPSTAYVAFTGSTGSVTDRHYVRDAAISAG